MNEAVTPHYLYHPLLDLFPSVASNYIFSQNEDEGPWEIFTELHHLANLEIPSLYTLEN